MPCRKKADEKTPLLAEGGSPPAAAAAGGGGCCSGGGCSKKKEEVKPVPTAQTNGSGKMPRGADCGPDGHREELTKETSETRRKQKISLAAGVGMCMIFMLVEIVGGYLAHSLAIMTDAAHLLTDVGALSLSYFAIHISETGSNNQYTFGWHRAEIIGALVSIFSIWFLTGIILYEAFQRMWIFSRCARLGPDAAAADVTCEAVNGKLMTVVGVLGLLVNVTLAGILLWGGAKVQHAHSHGEGGCPSEAGKKKKNDDVEAGHGHGHGHGHSHGAEKSSHGGHGHSHGGHESANVNVQSAYLHALGDCINSLGVIIAAGIIWWGNSGDTNAMSVSSWYNLADPAASILFGVITLWTTWGLTQQVMDILMEGVPKGVNYNGVQKSLERIENVLEVHDLHIWSLTTDKLSLSAHLEGDTKQHSEQILRDAQELCNNHHPPITHTTFQIDPKGDCCTARCFSDMH